MKVDTRVILTLIEHGNEAEFRDLIDECEAAGIPVAHGLRQKVESSIREEFGEAFTATLKAELNCVEWGDIAEGITRRFTPA